MAVVPLLVRDNYCPAGFEPLTICTVTGIRKYYQELPDGKARLVSIQPADAILNQNANERYDAKGTFTKRGKWGFQAARIPVTLFNELRYHEDGSRLDPEDFDKRISQVLNDGDFSKFRIGEANI